MNLLAIENGEIEQGLDRRNLTILRKRFLSINQQRLTRMRDALSDRQKLFLDTLALLFHTNHPMMPGFCSRVTPCRLANYKPEKADIQLGRMIARSFTLPHESGGDCDIYGIYVMGSVGTIAQSESSDLDIWLCHRPGLTPTQLINLNKKCTLISAWAMEIRLEVHFFLMDSEAFKHGKLDALNEESSGSAQRLLLLDEFYRTAIYMGGRMPLWWFIPKASEDNYKRYAEVLLHKRFIRDDSVLDFGGIATLPDGEFVGAAIWQLYKAIESPYKSVLKLLLLEAYAHQHPKIRPLSLSYKKLVYKGRVDINELDSYLMVYRHIEQYLIEKQQHKRLELARRCFYFKVNKPLSLPPKGRQKSWQRELLEDLTAAWGWSDQYLASLDKRAQWKAPRVAEERGLLVAELNNSYHFLQRFATETGAVRAISNEEITILGRKLQAAFERRPGKLEWINPGISDDIGEPIVSLSEVYDESSNTLVWTSFAHTLNDPNGNTGIAIKSSANLVELVLWSYFNQVIQLSTRFDLQQSPSINPVELNRLLQALQHWLPLPLPTLDHDAFKHSARPVSALILINAGKSPTPQLDQQGMQRLSSNVDALRYSGFEENLVASVDLVTRNSWNEINTRRFDRETALLDALQEFLQLSLPGTHQQPPKLEVACVGATHASIIATRVESWFAEICSCFYDGRYPATTRYLFEMGGKYYSLQFRGPRMLVREHRNIDTLIGYLGEEQQTVSPIKIDSRALKDNALPAITAAISGSVGGRAWSGAIDVFYRRFDIGMELYVLDEFGSLIHTQHLGSNRFSPLKPLHYFLRSVINRHSRMNQELLQDFGVFPIHFYELKHEPRKGFSCQQRRIASELQSDSGFEVKAVALPDANNEVSFDFYCDEQEFSSVSFGEQLFLVVGQFIIAQRQSNENYPVYITDLDLSLCINQLSESRSLQISHYLKLKRRLEFKLNQAIGILLAK
ncbi:class I adenylate cyclase [Teredinibacter waterburyi]|uniref:class I adenylate cyclase n=1 Tax=Teredinibacter waterburyi TaxID=1500538 RepID=UPI00165F85BC|nr:class I adenylate cyclase [Teredinibacter waterburyi]